MANASLSPAIPDLKAFITGKAPCCRLLKLAISPDNLKTCSVKSAASCSVKPIPCATDPNTAVNCLASELVKPNKLADFYNSLFNLSAAVLNVCPNAADASNAEEAA